MAAGTVVSARKDAVNAYVAVVVAEGGAAGNVEYSGSTPLLKVDGTAKSPVEVKADLLASVSAQRNAQVAASSALAGVSGSVTV